MRVVHTGALKTRTKLPEQLPKLEFTTEFNGNRSI